MKSKSLASMSQAEFVEFCVTLLEYRNAYDRMYRRAVKALVLHRFKRLPRGAERRIDEAFIDQLEEWYRRAGKAKTAESVFEERQCTLLPVLRRS